MKEPECRYDVESEDIAQIPIGNGLTLDVGFYGEGDDGVYRIRVFSGDEFSNLVAEFSLGVNAFMEGVPQRTRRQRIQKALEDSGPTNHLDSLKPD